MRDEIELLADGTTLASAPVFEVSSTTGAGLDNLRAEIVRQLDGFQARRATGAFDCRSTAPSRSRDTASSSPAPRYGRRGRVGDKLRVLPSGAEVRVRSIQAHSDAVESAGLGQRVALNLTGAEARPRARRRAGYERLDAVTSRFDAWLEIRPAAKRALKNNTRVRLFIGTAETIARAIVLDEAGAIAPKGAGFAQLVTEDAVVALAGDRFVIRDETNSRTLGGGIVLNPLGRRARKPVEVYRANLRLLKDSSGADAIEALIDLNEAFALGTTRIAMLMNIPIAEAEAVLRETQRFVKLSVATKRRSPRAPGGRRSNGLLSTR